MSTSREPTYFDTLTLTNFKYDQITIECFIGPIEK